MHSEGLFTSVLTSLYCLLSVCYTLQILTGKKRVDLVVAYMGALKAGATVSVIDPQYPPERQKVLLDIARPRFLICIDMANKESGPLSESVMEFVASNLSLKSTIPALALAIFVLLPLFYGITSHGYAQLQVFGRRLPPKR